MRNSRKDGIILFLSGVILLAFVGLFLYMAIPMHISESEIEGSSSYNSVGRIIVGLIVCFWTVLLSGIIIIIGLEYWLQRKMLPKGLSVWQKSGSIKN
ncbi:MAG: hypothetical protein CO183_01050 [Candidatus Zambryskibacteria bacterium CG_4_9_14_3_um_filter_42_9]|uniref:Uncharacterized protein n=1 Tax=Candidatus Zambryskibacteria bacterium CG22_combo_CG10-13_8_21_14_all_42_17 TaxID=1975118 RepID=A0A2H0BDI9_9BACT|nr:MAG: hypothetical protein COX06_02235 [Candidatus Zambryskibacteria bacterium CG22_combo_CG10-13_8_21_14_all_42_17]PJA36921.1 MAG: hypothetical protein CO183_01050 [Candidatus Zambryskibacteria bacterium CG_4_9_14_3_um_filter_42_9]